MYWAKAGILRADCCRMDDQGPNLAMKGPAGDAAALREAWYYALPSFRLRRRAVAPKLMLGEPLLIGRDGAGAPFAVRDLCPHRGMPLSAGRFDGQEIECCYHGWR